MTKTRNLKLARIIYNLSQAYCFIFRPNTRGVKIIVKTLEEKFLLVRLTYFPNTWTFPGGGVSRNENYDSAAQRELKEETGIQIDKQKLRLVGAMEFKHEYKKDTVQIFAGVSEEIKLVIDGKEVAEAGWFLKSEFPSMGPNTKRIFEFYEKKLILSKIK